MSSAHKNKAGPDCGSGPELYANASRITRRRTQHASVVAALLVVDKGFGIRKARTLESPSVSMPARRWRNQRSAVLVSFHPRRASRLDEEAVIGVQSSRAAAPRSLFSRASEVRMYAGLLERAGPRPCRWP